MERRAPFPNKVLRTGTHLFQSESEIGKKRKRIHLVFKDLQKSRLRKCEKGEEVAISLAYRIPLEIIDGLQFTLVLYFSVGTGFLLVIVEIIKISSPKGPSALFLKADFRVKRCPFNNWFN
jgi:hypothetical protein